MINTTEFGDLDAGDIYMPLGDISGFGGYLPDIAYTHGEEDELNWGPDTKVVVIGHKDPEPERPTGQFIIIHKGDAYGEPIPDGSSGIRLGDSGYRIRRPDGSYLGSFFNWSYAHIDEWEDAALVPVGVLEEARKLSDGWLGTTYDDASDFSAPSRAFDLLHGMARDYLPKETSDK